jgi:hypothetical membrane protein
VVEVREQRALLAAGVLAGSLFAASVLVEGAVRPDYDPLRHPVSSLSLVPGGWTQMVTFLVTGALVTAFAVGLRHRHDRRAVPVLLALVGIGLIGAGVFPADPLNGYPPGTPAVAARTVEGSLHRIFSTPVFTALPAAAIVVGRRAGRRGRRAWARYSTASGVLLLACFVLTSVGFAQVPGLVDVAGLLQRLTLGVGFAWLTTLAVRCANGDGDVD